MTVVVTLPPSVPAHMWSKATLVISHVDEIRGFDTDGENVKAVDGFGSMFRRVTCDVTASFIKQNVGVGVENTSTGGPTAGAWYSKRKVAACIGLASDLTLPVTTPSSSVAGAVTASVTTPFDRSVRDPTCASSRPNVTTTSAAPPAARSATCFGVERSGLRFRVWD